MAQRHNGTTAQRHRGVKALRSRGQGAEGREHGAEGRGKEVMTYEFICKNLRDLREIVPGLRETPCNSVVNKILAESWK